MAPSAHWAALAAWAGQHKAQQSISIYCEAGVVEISLLAHSAEIHRPGHKPKIVTTVLEEMSKEPSKNLVNLCLKNGENESPAESAWHAVELLDAAYRSVQQDGRPIDVKELYDEDS